MRLLDEQLAIALDRIQRRTQLMPQPSGVAGGLNGLRDQFRKLRSGGSHALEVGDEVCKFVAARVLDQNVEKADDRGDRGAEFLPQERRERMLESPAAHERSPSRVSSASIFCNSRGSSTGFVS